MPEALLPLLTAIASVAWVLLRRPKVQTESLAWPRDRVLLCVTATGERLYVAYSVPTPDGWLIVEESASHIVVGRADRRTMIAKAAIYSMAWSV